MASRTQGPGRPKDMEKRAAILDAAKHLFTEQSFQGTSMDAVAASAGVSKLTVYSHFGDKDNLFREVVRDWMREYLPERTYELDPALDIRGNLLRVARIHAHLDCSLQAAGSFRAILSDCHEGVPRFGRLIWDEGFVRTQSMFERMLRRAVAAGALAIDDVPRAAMQFMVLVKGYFQIRLMLGCTDGMQDHECRLDANAEASVDMFMRAYAPR